MWTVLMLVLFLLTITGVLYLANRIGKFSIIQKYANGKKIISTLIGLIIAIAVTAVLWKLWGSMNAIICVLHLLVFWLISDGIFALIQKYRKKSFSRYYAGIFAGIFTVCYLGAGWYLAHHVWETDYQIKTDKKVGSLRVAVFSDSHVGATFDGDGFAKHMKTINTQNPDIVLIVGDFVDDDTTKEDMIRSCQALGEMTPAYGIYYIMFLEIMTKAITHLNIVVITVRI